MDCVADSVMLMLIWYLCICAGQWILRMFKHTLFKQKPRNPMRPVHCYLSHYEVDSIRCWQEIVFCFRWSSLLFHSFSTMDWVFQREKLRWWWKQVWQGGCHSCPQRTVSQYCSRCRVTHSYGMSPVGRIILWSVTWLLENEKCWTLSCFTDPAPISPACRALSCKPASHRCCCRLMGPMDRQTNGRSTFHRPCSAYYVDSKCTSSLLNMILLYFVSVFKIVNLHFVYMPYFFTIFHQ